MAAAAGLVSLGKIVSEEKLVSFRNLTSPGSSCTVQFAMNGRPWKAVATRLAGSVSLVMKCLDITADETTIVHVKTVDLRAKPMVAYSPRVLVGYHCKAAVGNLPPVEALTEHGCGTNGSFSLAMDAHVIAASKMSVLGQDLVRLLESHVGSDISFCIGDKEFPAHKAIIQACCPALAEIVAASPCSTVQIDGDVDPEAFLAFLKHLYTGKLPDDPTEGHDKEAALMFTQTLFLVAERFKSDTAKTLCEARMMSILSAETAASTIIFAQKHHRPKLQAFCCKNVVSRGWLLQVLNDMDLGVENGFPTDAKDALLMVASKELKGQGKTPLSSH